jgi:hypothetical protein
MEKSKDVGMRTRSQGQIECPTAKLFAQVGGGAVRPTMYKEAIAFPVVTQQVELRLLASHQVQQLTLRANERISLRKAQALAVNRPFASIALWVKVNADQLCSEWNAVVNRSLEHRLKRSNLAVW